MADENKTIVNSADPRVDNSNYIYSGNQQDEDIYIGSSAILMTLRDEGILPPGFNINAFNSQEEFNSYVASLPISETTRNTLYSYNIIKPTDNIEITDAAFIEGQSLKTNSQGKTPVESLVMSYDPQNYNIPSIRNRGVGLAADDTTMNKVLTNDPLEGKVIPQVLRTSQYNDIIPMFLDMVDSNMNRQGIYLGEKYIITTIRLNPNPNTLTINSSKKINRYNTMTRWVEEHWGDEIDNASLTGSSFSFFGYFGPSNPENVGLTISKRDITQAYKQMKELINFFQFNGCIYQNASEYEAPGHLAVTDFLNSNPEFANNHPRKGMIKERLYLRLVYDYFVLLGRFESFDLIEDATMPFRFQYNAIFKAEKTIYRLDKAPNNGSVVSPSNIRSADQSNFSNSALNNLSQNIAQSGAFV